MSLNLLTRNRALILASLVLGIFCTSSAFAQQSTLDKIVSSKTLRVGVAEFAPIAQKNLSTGQLEGFDVDAANMLGEEMGVKVEIVEASWDTIIAGLQANKYDIIMSGLKRTVQRAVSVSFSDPYLSLTEHALVRADSGINSWADVDKNHNPVAVVLGGAAYTKLDSVKDEYLKSAVMLPFKELTVCGNAVMTKQAVAWVEDSLSLATFAKAHPEVPMKIIDLPFSQHAEGNGYAVRHEDQDFLNIVNIFVWKMKNDGSYKKLAKKWGLPDDMLVPGYMTLQVKPSAS